MIKAYLVAHAPNADTEAPEEDLDAGQYDENAEEEENDNNEGEEEEIEVELEDKQAQYKKKPTNTVVFFLQHVSPASSTFQRSAISRRQGGSNYELWVEFLQ